MTALGTSKVGQRLNVISNVTPGATNISPGEKHPLKTSSVLSIEDVAELFDLAKVVVGAIAENSIEIKSIVPKVLVFFSKIIACLAV
jgi:hypothetical protein